MTFSESGTLIRRIAGGDASALTSLYDSTSPLIFGLVLRVIRDRSAAQEVLLDVYTQVWQRASSYDSTRGAPLAWLMTIARTRAIDRLRADRHEREQGVLLEQIRDNPSTGADPEEESIQSERRRLVRRALDSISAEQRQVIELAYFRGLSHREIAVKLGEPLGTVKTRVRLGMIRLSDMLRHLFN